MFLCHKDIPTSQHKSTTYNPYWKYFDVHGIGVSHDVITKVNRHVRCDVVCTVNTDMRRLTEGIRSQKCVIRQFRRCTNVIQCTYTQSQTVQYSLLHTYAIRYSLLLLGYKPVQHVTVLNTVGNCNTMVSIVILYCNVMGPPSYMRSVVDRNVVMRRMTVCAEE